MIRGVRGARGVVPLDVLVGDARRKGHARALGPVEVLGDATKSALEIGLLFKFDKRNSP